MKLYLISDDINLRVRWIGIFSNLQSIVFSEVSLDMEPDSIVIVLDKMLADISKISLKKLFEHRVMVLSMTPDFTQAQNFLQLGAMGYGNAMMHESHLYSVYQALEEGNIWLHPNFISLMISQIRDANNTTKEQSMAVLDVLSKREREVALMLGNGATHQEIADDLDITTRTVKAHATAIYQKLDVKDRLALSILLHT